jgi:hypothetical protein
MVQVWVKVFENVVEYPTAPRYVVGYSWVVAYSGQKDHCVVLMNNLSHKGFVCQMLDVGKKPLE